MKYATLFIFLTSTFFAQAQLTKGEATILSKPDGDKLFTINDSTRIAIGPQESGWYKTSVVAFVAKKSVSADSMLAADAILLKADKLAMGKVLADVKVDYRQAEGRGMYKFYKVIVSGYIKSYSIHYRSIPEKGLEEILNDSKVAGRNDRLAEFFKTHGFVKQEFGDYTAWVYLDKAGSLDEPTYRTAVIYRGETMIYAVVSRAETLKLDKLKDEQTHNTGNYFFYQKPNEKALREIQDIIYSFIPL